MQLSAEKLHSVQKQGYIPVWRVSAKLAPYRKNEFLQQFYCNSAAAQCPMGAKTTEATKINRKLQ